MGRALSLSEPNPQHPCHPHPGAILECTHPNDFLHPAGILIVQTNEAAKSPSTIGNPARSRESPHARAAGEHHVKEI